MTLPVTIIGGYLGSGKTTLVNHTLRNANGEKIAVLVNEFGDIQIDADLIEGQDGDVIALAGGCVCCSYGDDLTGSLLDMAARDPKPDRVLLEASGVALPGAIAASLSLMEGFSLDGVVVVADASNIARQAADKYVGDTILRQLQDADLIVLNKADLADGVQAAITVLPEGSRTVGAQHGKIALFECVAALEERKDTYLSGHHHHKFVSRSLDLNGSVSRQSLEGWFQRQTASLQRAKGYFQDETGNFQRVQMAGGQVEFQPASSLTSPVIVLIGVETEDGPPQWYLQDEAALIEEMMR